MRQAKSTAYDSQLGADISILPPLGPRMSFFTPREATGLIDCQTNRCTGRRQQEIRIFVLSCSVLTRFRRPIVLAENLLSWRSCSNSNSSSCLPILASAETMLSARLPWSAAGHNRLRHIRQIAQHPRTHPALRHPAAQASRLCAHTKGSTS